jgi:CheY-like chemotaxis protein
MILLEENPAAQELIEQALRECGHRVLVTNDASEVREVARRLRIDLLVADVGLLEAGDALDSVRSVGRVLYINGSADSPPADADGAPVLASPFALEDLRKAVASALRRSR